MSRFKAQRDYHGKFPGWRSDWNDPSVFLHWIEEMARFYGSIPFSDIADHPYFGQHSA